jgi:hypothetical protein
VWQNNGGIPSFLYIRAWQDTIIDVYINTSYGII